MTQACRFTRFIALVAIIIGSASLSANAQIYNKKKSGSESKPSGVSALAEKNATEVARACLGNWENKYCLRASSQSALEMAATYAEALDNAGHEAALEVLKDQCAASTAATRGDYPAYAMTSAFTECANIIVDISEETGIEPDTEHYQLLVGTVLCLTKDSRCKHIETGLRRYK